MRTTLDWPGACGKPFCLNPAYMALATKDGSSPTMFFCRDHGLEFMAVVSLENQKDILLSGLGKMTVGR